jgi:hypothetical protein
MNPNLTTYYMAERANRQGLSARAEQGWRTRQADARRPRADHASTLRSVAGALLIRLGTHLGGFDPALTIASAAEKTARA